MTPHLYACSFADGQSTYWPRFARVLAMTAATHCSTWTRTIEVIAGTSERGLTGVPAHPHNTHKLARWLEIVNPLPDGTTIVLLDADIAVLRPLDDVWAAPFDLAYTVKKRPFPFNLGVLFLRVSDRTRAFLDTWATHTRALLRNPGRPQEQQAWRRQYGGISQKTFGDLLESGALRNLTLRTLPCAEWNCEESGWPTFDPAVTRILHCKGALRRTILKTIPMRPELKPLADRWLALERAAMTEDQARAS